MTSQNTNVCSACGSSLRPDKFCIMPLCVNGWSQEKATRHFAVITDELLAKATRSTPPPPPPDPRPPISRVFPKPEAVVNRSSVTLLRLIRVG